MSSAVLGANGEKIIVFYSFKDLREFNNFKLATESLISSSVIQSSVFIIFVKDESQLHQLPDNWRFKYITKKDFNFFRQLKNKENRELLKAKYDILLVLDHIEAPNVRMINKINAKKRIVSSLTEGINFDIRLNSSSIKIEQIASFVKNTLEKIQS